MDKRWKEKRKYTYPGQEFMKATIGSAPFRSTSADARDRSIRMHKSINLICTASPLGSYCSANVEAEFSD